MKLSDRELATVLAALRYWQTDLHDNPDGPINGPELGHFDQITPLTVEEIDELCQRLNSGEEP